MLKYILPVIPVHDTYIEPFAGGLAVFLAKDRVKVEVINDLNDEVSGFYLYVRSFPKWSGACTPWRFLTGFRKTRGLRSFKKWRAGIF